MRYKQCSIQEDEKFREDIVEGRNAVIEVLKSDKTVDQIFVANGAITGSINVVLALAKEKKVAVKRVDRKN
jgi:RNA 2''-O ribose methyltransferase substrate binding.